MAFRRLSWCRSACLLLLERCLYYGRCERMYRMNRLPWVWS